MTRNSPGTSIGTVGFEKPIIISPSPSTFALVTTGTLSRTVSGVVTRTGADVETTAPSFSARTCTAYRALERRLVTVVGPVEVTVF